MSIKAQRGECYVDEYTRRHAILIVDDETSVLKALKRLLQDEDYDVHTASNFDQTMELLSTHTFAVAISDFNMPGVTGDDLLGIIKSRCPATVRVMLSGTANSKSVPEEIADGILHCQLFMSKPWEDDELVKALRNCIARYEGALEVVTQS